ncbi:MAG: bifunctional nuclease family protein [Haliscomenobacter sp.]
MKKIELEIVALSHSVSQSSNYAVILSDKNATRRLPIVIGSFEAQAIAVALERMVPNRPLTHDLFKNVLDTFQIQLREVIINNLLDGIFYAQLICERNGEQIEIDSRSSDALALAARFRCPIYSFDFILDSAGIVVEKDDNDLDFSDDMNPVETVNPLSSYSIEALAKLLEEVLEEENYERAAQIRDEIDRRKAND